MKTRNKSIWFAAAVLLVAMLACGFEEEPESVPLPLVADAAEETQPPAEQEPTAVEEPAAECKNRYLPVVAGATWNYNLTGLFADTFTRQIITVETDRFTDQDTFGSGVVRQGRWTCRNGRLIALDPASGTSASISSEGVWVDYQTSDREGITLPASINAGDTWSQSLTIEGTLAISEARYEAKNQMTNTCTAIGIESVTVTAGVFDAMRVDCRTVMNISVNIPDKPNNTTLTLDITNWYAENVGLVKTVTAGEGLDSTVELLSYTIP